MDADDRRKRVKDEAAEWCVLLQGELTRAQLEQYVDWLRESTVHVAEMLHMAQVHGALEQFQRWSYIPTDGARDEEGGAVPLITAQYNADVRHGAAVQSVRRRGRMWIVAVTLLIVMTVVGMLLVKVDVPGRVIQTERGERRELALADGSVIQVDPESRLRVKYEQHARRVFLESGRVLFHVAKNVDRPFLVEANNTTVRAVGTAFAVERQSESIVVTVAEGKVAVIPPRSAPGNAPDASSSAGRAEMHKKVPAANSGNEAMHSSGQSGSPQLSAGSTPEILLTANQQVTVARSGTAEPLRAVDSGRVLAWAEGRLVFENTSIADAIREFNRYNQTQIIVNDAKLARRPITGVFNAADPESFVAFMQLVTRIHVTRNDGADITIETAQ